MEQNKKERKFHSVSLMLPSGLLRIFSVLPPGTNRVETGPVAFNEDWPGIFIRGDEAFALSFVIRDTVRRLENIKPDAQVAGSNIKLLISQLNDFIILLDEADAARHREEKYI